MEEEIKVEETPAEETPETPAEETLPSETTEEKKPEEEKGSTVPIGRFNEVYRKQKELEERIETLQTKKDEGTLTPEQQNELKAKEYLKTLLKETLKEEQEQSSKQEVKEQEDFEGQVKSTLENNVDVKKDEFLKFIEDNDEKYDFSSVKQAMAIYRDLNNLSKDVAEKTKKDILRKPSSPSSDTTGEHLPDDTKKSFQQIVREEAARLRK